MNNGALDYFGPLGICLLALSLLTALVTLSAITIKLGRIHRYKYNHSYLSEISIGDIWM